MLVLDMNTTEEKFQSTESYKNVPPHNVDAAGRISLKEILETGNYRILHWAHLFETLRRTVDSIYEICRLDCSVIECKVQRRVFI